TYKKEWHCWRFRRQHLAPSSGRPEIQRRALTRRKRRAPHKRFTDEQGRAVCATSPAPTSSRCESIAPILVGAPSGGIPWANRDLLNLLLRRRSISCESDQAARPHRRPRACPAARPTPSPLGQDWRGRALPRSPASSPCAPPAGAPRQDPLPQQRPHPSSSAPPL